jgi:predicted signal transduction protein with EAL and GGDEF domain
VQLARTFEREVIAEGVETPAHAAALLALGCEFGQGFGIARPMPGAHLGPWFSWQSLPEEGTATPIANASHVQDLPAGQVRPADLHGSLT